MEKFKRSARKAIATFLFASIGSLAGNNILGIDAEAWKVLLGTGLGAVLNLVYRWSEAVVKEPAE